MILITHHVEEVIPEIERVVLLDRGRVAASGAKEEMLSPALLSTIFGAPVSVSLCERVFHRAGVGGSELLPASGALDRGQYNGGGSSKTRP